MNTDIVIYLTLLFGLFMGWLPAAIAYRRKIVALRKLHRAQDKATFHYAFAAGWDASLESPMRVKNKYEELFGNPK